MIYALGNVSGAHFNPAVTVAILISGRGKDSLTPVDAIKYIMVQLLGGVCAALTYRFIRNGDQFVSGSDSFGLGPGSDYNWIKTGIAETIFTFVLCFVVLSVAVSPTTKSTTFFGLAIGSCVTTGGYAIGAISGGSLNPAVSFGIATGHMAGIGFRNALAYSLFEILGAAMAAGAFCITHTVDLAATEGVKDE